MTTYSLTLAQQDVIWNSRAHVLHQDTPALFHDCDKCPEPLTWPLNTAKEETLDHCDGFWWGVRYRNPNSAWLDVAASWRSDLIPTPTLGSGGHSRPIRQPPVSNSKCNIIIQTVRQLERSCVPGKCCNVEVNFCFCARVLEISPSFHLC